MSVALPRAPADAGRFAELTRTFTGSRTSDEKRVEARSIPAEKRFNHLIPAQKRFKHLLTMALCLCKNLSAHIVLRATRADIAALSA